MRKFIISLFFGFTIAGGLTSQVWAVDYEYAIETEVTISLKVYAQGDENWRDNGATATATTKVETSKITNIDIIRDAGLYYGINFTGNAKLLVVGGDLVIRDTLEGESEPVDTSVGSIEVGDSVRAYKFTYNYSTEAEKAKGTTYEIMAVDIQEIFGMYLYGLESCKYTYIYKPKDSEYDVDYLLWNCSAQVSGYGEEDGNSTVVTGTIKIADNLIKTKVK